MKSSVSAMIIIMIVAMSCIAQQNYQPNPNPPGRYVFNDSGAYPVESLDRIIQTSRLIIDGTVDKVLPSVQLGPNSPTALETYSIISVNKVFRGRKLPEGQQSAAIVEPGGNKEGYEVVFNDHPLVKKGERYILFLEPDERKGVANNLGMFRYLLIYGCASKVKITETGTLQILPGAKALQSYDGLADKTFITILTERIDSIYKPLLPRIAPANLGPPPSGALLPPVRSPQP